MHCILLPVEFVSPDIAYLFTAQNAELDLGLGLVVEGKPSWNLLRACICTSLYVHHSQTNYLISEGRPPTSLLLQSHRSTVREKELAQLTTTFVLIKSRDGEGGEKRRLVVDWQDGGAVLHLRQEGKGRGETLANALMVGGREGERGREGGREGEREGERFSSLVEYI